MFGGYRQYLAARLAAFLKRGRIREASAFLTRAARQPGVSKSYLLQKCAEFLLPQQVQAPLRRVVGRETMPPWMNETWFREQGVDGAQLANGNEAQLLKANLLSDLQATNLPSLLRYEDRNSMAFSIESRVPFLTTDLVDFVFSLPEEYLISADGTSKAVFRHAMRGLVPEAILKRRDKIGFGTPEAQWLSVLDSWVRPLLGGAATAAIPAIDPARVNSVWEETLRGKRRFDFQLWRIFNVIYWTQHLQVRYT
jgi:asparagine synthase (glutamine-hydrolysing)